VSATSITLRGRVAAENLMLDAITIKRTTGSVTDPDTGADTPTQSTLYTGKAKVQQQAASASPTPLGEAEVFVAQVEVHVPITVTGIRPDDLVTVTASALDADLVGKTYRVRGVADKSFLTARRLAVIGVSG
jgi:Family of unknown function (DUF6093)